MKNHRTRWIAALLALIPLASTSCASHSESAPMLGKSELAQTDQDSVSAIAASATGAAAPKRRVVFDQDYKLWTQILKANKRGDLLNYRGVAEQRTLFDRFIAQLESVTLEEMRPWKRNERYAFWINAYNAYTVQIILDNYPVDSIKDIKKGVFGSKTWDIEFIPLGALHPGGPEGKLSLNDIEHKILREWFKDARVHAAINCASFSCPPLLGEAFVAARLEEQLNAVTRKWISDDPLRNSFNKEKDRIYLSEIFKWFEEDFERDAGSVREFLIRFSPESEHLFIREAKLKYLDYDWNLNDIEHT